MIEGRRWFNRYSLLEEPDEMEMPHEIEVDLEDSGQHQENVPNATLVLHKMVTEDDISGFKELFEYSKPHIHVSRNLFSLSLRLKRLEICEIILNSSKNILQVAKKNTQMSVIKKIIANKYNTLLPPLLDLRQAPLSDKYGRTLLLYAKIYRNRGAEKYLSHNLGLTTYWSDRYISQHNKIDMLLTLGGGKAQKYLGTHVIGTTHRHLYPIVADVWNEFRNDPANNLLSPIEMKHIEHCIIQAVASPKIHRIVEKIQTGQTPILIQTGSIHHSVTVVFYKNLVFLCNRGMRPDDEKQLLIVKRAPNEGFSSLTEVISKIRSFGYSKFYEDYELEYLHNGMFEDLKAIPFQRMERAIQKYCPLSEQSNKNCVSTSLRTALLAMTIGFCYSRKLQITPAQEEMKLCWAMYKKFSNLTRERALDLIQKVV